MRLEARGGLRSTEATRHIDLSSSYRQSGVLTMVIARLAYVTKLPGPTEPTAGPACERSVICAAQRDKWRYMGHVRSSRDSSRTAIMKQFLDE